MPEISRFLGIIIAMYYDDHRPPHFHAKYGEHEVTVRIGDGAVTGEFPRCALSHVIEWMELHEDELAANWDRVEEHHPPESIAPLE